MKMFTEGYQFEDYQRALEGAGPQIKGVDSGASGSRPQHWLYGAAATGGPGISGADLKIGGVPL